MQEQPPVEETEQPPETLAEEAEQAAETPGEEVVETTIELPEWVPEQIRDLWLLIQDQPLLAFVVIVVVGYVLAVIARNVICRGIARLTAKTETDFDDRLIELLHRPVFQTVFLCALVPATRTLGLPFTKTVVHILQTIVVLTWLFAGFPISRLVLEGLGAVRDRFQIIEERTIPLFDITMKLLLFGGATYVVLLIWGINPAAWLASAGVLGIAVGFAAKDTLANLFAGFFIVADTPYKLGDFVILPT
ncbi:MAG: mechanosensitive ion channel family protein, partial [bacterium]|nr:mechanosensitive ion channel family protein [bacterium]